MLLNGCMIIGVRENNKLRLDIWQLFALPVLAFFAFFKVWLTLSIQMKLAYHHDQLDPGTIFCYHLNFNDPEWWIMILLCTTVLDLVLRGFGYKLVNRALNDMDNTDEEKRPLVGENENVESNNIDGSVQWMKSKPEIVPSILWATLGVILLTICFVILTIILVFCAGVFLMIPIQLDMITNKTNLCTYHILKADYCP